MRFCSCLALGCSDRECWALKRRPLTFWEFWKKLLEHALSRPPHRLQVLGDGTSNTGPESSAEDHAGAAPALRTMPVTTPALMTKPVLITTVILTIKGLLLPAERSAPKLILTPAAKLQVLAAKPLIPTAKPLILASRHAPPVKLKLHLTPWLGLV